VSKPTQKRVRVAQRQVVQQRVYDQSKHPTRAERGAVRSSVEQTRTSILKSTLNIPIVPVSTKVRTVVQPIVPIAPVISSVRTRVKPTVPIVHVGKTVRTRAQRVQSCFAD
jgi:hypothetical protein